MTFFSNFIKMYFIIYFSLDNLRTYLNETITLELVGDTTVFDIDWLSVYDLQTKENYGWVLIPDEPNVPPSLQKVAVSIICVFIIIYGNK